MEVETTITWQRVKEVLDLALELSAAERPAFLAQHCGDADLHRRVVSVLAAYDSGTLSARVLSPHLEEMPRYAEGDSVGPWRLERSIGEGGMGTVFLASRADDSYEKKVALKLLRGGWGGEEMRRRFRIERQILADLDHPGIAKLLDGGNTADGQPYLVMEFVEGFSLEEFCERKGFDLQARLDLFLQVCEAVQFAHQKLIVHRDLKPSNVLVGQDGTVKLLDFGIAKILRPGEFAEPVMATQTGVMPMTPAFASPEQIRGQSITTATDVYALGVLLYRLVTGRHPYEVRGADLESLVETVCRGEVPLPSQRLRQLGTTPPSAAVPVGISARHVVGDLDAIILKALAKDPAQRYATAEQLSEDLERYRRSEPVRAQRNTFLYRSTKFIRRHRWPLALAATAFLLLVSGILVLLQQRQRLIVERNRARTVANWMVELFQMPDPGRSLGARITALELLEKSRQSIHQDLAGEPEVLATMLGTLGETFYQLGQLPQAAETLRSALELQARYGFEPRSQVELLEKLTLVSSRAGRWQEAAETADQALGLADRWVPDHDPLRARLLGRRAFIAGKLGHANEAKLAFEQALEAARKGGDAGILANVLSDYALEQQSVGEIAAARQLAAEALQLQERLRGAKHPWVGELRASLAVMRVDLDPAAAETELRQVVQDLRTVYPGDHPSLATAIKNLGTLLESRARYDEAEDAYLEALAMNQRLFGDSHPHIAAILQDLGNLMATRGDLEQTASYLDASLAMYRLEYGEDHPDYAQVQARLAACELQRGHQERARELVEAAKATLAKHLGPAHPRFAEVLMVQSDLDVLDEQYESALAAAHRGIAIFRAEKSPDFAHELLKLCRIQTRIGRHEEAVQCLEEAVALPSQDPRTSLYGRTWLALAQLKAQRLAAAEATAREVLMAWRAQASPEQPWILSCLQTLGLALLRQGKLDEAEAVLIERRQLAAAVAADNPAVQAKIAAEFTELAAARQKKNSL